MGDYPAGRWLGRTIRGGMCRLTRYYVSALCSGEVPAAACTCSLSRSSSRCPGDDQVDAVGHKPESDDQAPRDDDLVGVGVDPGPWRTTGTCCPRAAAISGASSAS